jgi:organic hydroperoxide reductase OsmC/OhrA
MLVASPAIPVLFAWCAAACFLIASRLVANNDKTINRVAMRATVTIANIKRVSRNKHLTFEKPVMAFFAAEFFCF